MKPPSTSYIVILIRLRLVQNVRRASRSAAASCCCLCKALHLCPKGERPTEAKQASCRHSRIGKWLMVISTVTCMDFSKSKALSLWDCCAGHVDLTFSSVALSSHLFHGLQLCMKAFEFELIKWVLNPNTIATAIAITSSSRILCLFSKSS